MFKMVQGMSDFSVIHGFKIHISATITNYKAIFQIVYPILLEEGVCFKYIERHEDVLCNFSEYESPAESGKYITIYPTSREECLRLLELLYKKIPKDWQGIYILSDRSYKDSNTIFYRYGFFEDNVEYMVDGIPTLIGPSGEVWQDYQKNYFDLPSWVSDLQEPQVLKESYLGQHYQLTKVLQTRNSGNTYQAIRKMDGQQVILKESRPHMLSLDNVEKRQLREQEYRMAQLLETSNHTPKPIERVSEWVNEYFIYEAIDGQDLSETMTPFSIFNYSKQASDENRDKFSMFLEQSRELLKLVHQFHQAGVTLNDIHDRNIIRTSTGKLYFIDLENSYYSEADNLVGIYNEISLPEWNSISGQTSDCYKIANLLLHLLGRLQVKNKNEYQAGLVDDLLGYYGIKSSFSNFIHYLFSDAPNLSEALAIFDRIEVEESTYQYELSLTEEMEDIQSLSLQYLIDQTKFEDYCQTVNDPTRFQVLLDRERNFGLDGLSGLLGLIQLGKIPVGYDEKIKEKIIAAIVDTEKGKSLSYGVACASPYLHTGAAGFLKVLLEEGNVEDDDLIHQLTPALLVDYAQYTDYRTGMLGVSDVLLDVYERFMDKNILDTVERQLIIAGIKAQYHPSLRNGYQYVLARYRRMKNVIFEKQTV